MLDKAIYFALLITITLTVLSFIKVPVKGLSVPFSDKTYHTIAYFFLTLSWLYTFVKKVNIISVVWYVLLGCFIYGTIIEVLQGTITPYRTASYLDIVANSVGIIIATLAFHLFEKKIRLI